MVEWLQILLNASAQADTQKKFDAAASLLQAHDRQLDRAANAIADVATTQMVMIWSLVFLIVQSSALVVTMFSRQASKIDRMEKRLRKLSRLLDTEFSDVPIRSAAGRSPCRSSET